ncbi:glycosyltransferase family 61 protein [Rhizosaccharibacter radicis]|uniref:Glycosyltransferase family 61 protein n=1 Tax=Rhizosaccharibacter radicis TaxID=2782605 RepID=A0ABT1W1N8_9PROT|nr:glycosyltransferase family 61 protein [Acetobacteraceae bacterium KSS12]
MAREGGIPAADAARGDNLLQSRPRTRSRTTRQQTHIAFIVAVRHQQEDLMRYTSCAPSGMYRNGAWSDSAALLNEFFRGDSVAFAPELVEELYEPYGYRRSDPVVLGKDARGLSGVMEIARSVNDHHGLGPASVLCRLDEACLANNVVYNRAGGELSVVYESHLPGDRALNPLRPASALAMPTQSFGGVPNRRYLWMGSAGSANYGHWLIDDLPKVAAIEVLLRQDPHTEVHVLLPDCGDVHNTIHLHSIGLMLGAALVPRISIHFIDIRRTVWVEGLHFATPVSRHPYSKSPDAVAYVANRLPAAIRHLDPDQKRRRLFVTRPPSDKRNLLNPGQVEDFLTSLGFELIETSRMGIVQQIALFSAADVVVGCMGAAMTNTIFCDPGTRVVHLTPDGWVEPFYWDLSSIRNHEYVAIYGDVASSGASPPDRDFRIDLDDLKASLGKLEMA